MIATKAYAAHKAKDTLKPFDIQRREPKDHDVLIKIRYCGICHSDLHQVKNEWGNSTFPMVPGHEIVGEVIKTGAKVSKFHVGDKVGVGCFVDSCRQCKPCKDHVEQYCDKGASFTYNGVEQDGKTPTFGGYSTHIVVDENYVLKIPDSLALDKAAPLLCAGITTYSPLHYWKIKAGDKVGVVGLGGLGHMAVKIAAAMGAEVWVFSTSDKKKDDAMRMGAKKFINTKDPNVFAQYANQLDFIINTVSANIDLNQYLSLLKLNATMVLVGVPEHPDKIDATALIMRRRNLAGSVIGGIKETQEMLDFCGKHNIGADVEVIPITKVNEAYERMLKGDVHYRFVIDTETI